ncbi:IucA/IucC family C-terminal-domain containing protein [Aggregatilinea lenta]|uniref:IucA/IucC family C-terminal-domain containing protein n=1 Tax=Aggregatilinea lenta TaxID=913108 RepID=UPI000E5BBACA|nr:IucA/IucC family C-terminal-domain containing protein [Aggregatilinea lenta]
MVIHATKDTHVTNEVTPLDGTLQRLVRLYPYLELRTGDDLPPGWVNAKDLIASGSPHLPRLVRTVGATSGTDDRQVAVSFFLNGYAWLVAVVGLGCLLAEGRVPDLTFEDVALRFDEQGNAAGMALSNGRFLALPQDRDADHHRATIVPDRGALRDAFRHEIEAHMAHVIPALRAQSSLGTRALWITVIDRCATFLYWANHLKPDLVSRETVRDDVAALAHVPGSPMANKLTRLDPVDTPDGPALALRRGSCCLNYRRPDGELCDSCPIRKE